MKKRIPVETVNKDNEDHIDKCVRYFFGDGVHFGTVMGVKEVIYDRLDEKEANQGRI